jgi:protein O-GlcNAc transferase
LNGLAVDEEQHMALAHQNYRSGKYREALEHGNAVYEKNPICFFLELSTIR